MGHVGHTYDVSDDAFVLYTISFCFAMDHMDFIHVLSGMIS